MVDLATKADSVSTRRAGCTCDNEPIPIVGEVRRVLETGCDDGKLHASAGVPRSIVGSTIKIISISRCPKAGDRESVSAFYYLIRQYIS
jgi:hypothetical protein